MEIDAFAIAYVGMRLEDADIYSDINRKFRSADCACLDVEEIQDSEYKFCPMCGTEIRIVSDPVVKPAYKRQQLSDIRSDCGWHDFVNVAQAAIEANNCLLLPRQMPGQVTVRLFGIYSSSYVPPIPILGMMLWSSPNLVRNASPRALAEYKGDRVGIESKTVMHTIDTLTKQLQDADMLFRPVKLWLSTYVSM